MSTTEYSIEKDLADVRGELAGIQRLAQAAELGECPAYEALTEIVTRLSALNNALRHVLNWEQAAMSTTPTQHITVSQIRILRHALGLPENGRGRSYRNHFVTGPGSTDYDDCEALVAMGLMQKGAGSPLSGGAPVYSVTAEGRRVA